MSTTAPASQAVLIEDVRFRWKPGLPWCLDISRLTLAHGESLFLHGPSGSGKSTLLNLIGGVVVANQGGVHVMGHDFRNTAAAARDCIRADHVGFLFQQFNLVPYLTVVDNVLLPCRFSKRRAERCLLQSASPLDEARRLLTRLDLAPNLLHRRVTELSIGQQQRVAAARAMIGAPEIIVADEPTSALDAARQMAFLKLLLEQCTQAGSSLLFVSHDRRLESAFSRTLALGEINRAQVAETEA